MTETTDAPTVEEALIQFLYQAPIGLLQAANSGEITMINPMAMQLLMPLAPDGDLDNVFELLATLAPQLRAQAAAAPTGAAVCESLRLALPGAAAEGGTLRTLSLSLVRLDDARLMASVGDVTDAVAQEQQRMASSLRSARRIDALTQLPTRAVVLERIEHALAAVRDGGGALDGASFAVLFINCDRFNRVNVTLGASAGDELLRLMAGRIHRAVRPDDTVGRAATATAAVTTTTAGRLGGDEFVVVLEGVRRTADLETIASRLVDALGQPYAIDGQLAQITVSVGMVHGAEGGNDAEAVLQSAGIAMREAQRGGGGRWCRFEPAMKVLAARRGSLEADLRLALDRHELFVVYQPIVALAGGACVGAEALVRWRHPVRGLVGPVDFIAVAEETGLIGALGLQVLDEACRQFGRWQRELGAAAPRTVSVNVSRAQLGDPLLAGQVRHALAAGGMEPGQLQLEVTESLAAQDASVLARLHELKALGTTLALDDFGTGYSSLACLHQLPVDVIKIDRSFVSQVETSAHHRVLIEATLRVAQSLGLGTVAEGIETAGQAEALARLRCDKGQGYLYARPLTAAEATRWLVERGGAQPRTKPADAAISERV